MDVVGRFVEATHWPTAKKTAAFALGVFLPVALRQYLVSRFSLSRSGIVEMGWFDAIFGFLIACSIGIGLLSAWVASRGWRGEWTYYVYLGTYILATSATVYPAGLNSAVAFYP